MENKNLNFNRWLMLVPTMLATFMFALDETIANIALPHIAGSFSVSHQESIWILTSYLIASCLTIPMLDWLCRLLGRKNLFIIMVTLFTVSSLICGVANSMAIMIIGRFFQGLGGGVLMPIAQAVVMESFKGKELTLAMTLFGMVVIIAPILGPAIGGYITENCSWHWIFFINIPIGIVIVALAKILIEDPPYARKQDNVNTDWSGLIFLVMFAVAFEITMDKGNDLDWFSSSFICKLTAIWIVGLIGFIVSQIKGKETLVRLNVLKNWNFAVGTISLTLMNAILLGSLAMIPQFMQTMMGYDAFTSGLTMMPRGIGCLIGVILTPILTPKLDPKFIISIGLISLSVGSWMLGDMNLQISQSSICIPNILFGLGMSLAMVPIISYSCETIASKEMSNASGLQNFIKTIGGAVGTSLVATFISRFSQSHQFMMVKNLTETNPVYIERLQAYTSSFASSTDLSTATHMAKQIIYNQLLQQSRLWAYIDSFRIYAVLSIVIIVLVFIMKKNQKQET